MEFSTLVNWLFRKERHYERIKASEVYYKDIIDKVNIICDELEPITNKS